MTNLEILNFNDTDFFPFPCVVTIGMFDGVHRGHQFMLQDLKKKAKDFDAKSAVITFANHPREILDSKQEKNPIELIQTKSERYKKIEKQGVDYIFEIDFTKEFSLLSPKDFLNILQKKTQLKALLLGYDNSFGNPNNSDFKEIVEKGEYNNTRIIQDKTALYEQGVEISSSAIRRAIKEGNILLANKMLGEEYSLFSLVVSGFQVGRSLGFSTANLQPSAKKIIPKNGVYATKVFYNDKMYGSVTNIGLRPTFEGRIRSVETHIFDFKEDIYNENLRVCFVDYLREEKRFENKQNLINQIRIDVKNAKKILA